MKHLPVWFTVTSGRKAAGRAAEVQHKANKKADLFQVVNSRSVQYRRSTRRRAAKRVKRTDF